MSELSINGTQAVIDDITKTSLVIGKDPQENIHAFQKKLVETSPKFHGYAALYDIWGTMPEGNRQDVIQSLNMNIQSYGTAESPFVGGGDYENKKTYALNALNNALPSIIENKAHKAWHLALVIGHASREPTKGSNSTFHSYKQDIDNTIRALYGNISVFNNNTPMKVGFPKDVLQKANVGQTEWDDSVNYFFAMAHRKYKGSLSFVPRSGGNDKRRRQDQVAKAFANKGAAPKDDGKFTDADGVVRQRINTPWDPFDPNDDEDMVAQENLMGEGYNSQWKQIYHDIVTKGGGNIWIERINDSRDLSRIRLVVVSGDREFPDDVKIEGDIYGMNQGRSETAGFTRENSVKFMQARQAWQWGNSQDDWWDTQDWIHSIVQVAEYAANKINPHLDAMNNKINQTLELGGEDRQSPLANFDWVPIEEGGDLSRDEFETLTNAYSKGAWEKKHDRKFIKEEFEAGLYEGLGGYSDLETNSFGGRYATEFTLPGRVEADMFLEPLMNEILAHEKSIGRKLTHESEDKDTIYDLINVVKSRLNKNPDFYNQGTSIFSYVLETDGKRNLFQQERETQTTSITDFVGRGIKHLQGEKGKALFDIARKLSPYLPDKDRPKTQAEILDPSTWELHPPMHGWLD